MAAGIEGQQQGSRPHQHHLDRVFAVLPATPSNWENPGAGAAPSGPRNRATASPGSAGHGTGRPLAATDAAARHSLGELIGSLHQYREASSSDTFQPTSPAPSHQGGRRAGEGSRRAAASTGTSRATPATDGPEQNQ